MSKKVIAALVLLTIGLVFFGISWRLTQIDLDSYRDRLVATENSLRNTNNELAQVKYDLSEVMGELQHTESYLSKVEEDLEVASVQLSATSEELDDTKSRLAAVKSEQLRLYNPTLKEAMEFMEEDETNSNQYIDNEYVCSHFAAAVNNNAEKMGIRCAFVDVRFPQSSHAIVAFETVDKGTVFFDPVTDDRVVPVIGKEYVQCIEPRPGYYYEEPTFDDTILDIVIIW